MKYLLPSLLLLLAAARLGAQGICDSTISIDPIQPICAGTGYVYLTASHPWGKFSEPTLGSGFSYLDAQYLSQGMHTLTYTLTGPGGCTVSVTRDFEVLDAPEAFGWASGDIDCSNPNSKATIMAFPPPNYSFGHWEGPNGGYYSGQNALVDYVGVYRYMAYPQNFNGCPAYASLEVGFVNNQVPIKIENCTNCNIGWPQKIRIAMVPPNWETHLTSPNGGGYYSPADSTGCFAAIISSGIWKVEAVNPENGCKSTASQYIDANHPTPSVSAGSNIGIWCNFAGSFLSAMSPASGSLFNYFWTRPDGSTAPASYGGLLQATVPGAYVLHGVNTFSGCEDTDTAYAVVAPTPVSTQIAVICAGESLFGHTQTGTYTDTVLQMNGCPKIRKLKIIALAPLVDSTEVGADNGLMNGSIQHFVTQGWAPFSYQWSNGDITSSIFNLSAGTYTVTVTDANNCEHVREVVVPLNKPGRPLAMNRETSILIKARLYPNPATAGLVECTLEINSNKAGEGTLLLNDVLGRNVSIRDIQIQEGKNVFSVSENLPEGVYAIFLKGDFGVKEVSKLVVAGGNKGGASN
ncbi:MAG: T9SS type A sorting domain-containing protein [Phycisphaerae bacterium]|nr:T9SS type A sorting domain-containing protein [Saprospiraceae bacterium]